MVTLISCKLSDYWVINLLNYLSSNTTKRKLRIRKRIANEKFELPQRGTWTRIHIIIIRCVITKLRLPGPILIYLVQQFTRSHWTFIKPDRQTDWQISIYYIFSYNDKLFFSVALPRHNTINKACAQANRKSHWKIWFWRKCK